MTFLQYQRFEPSPCCSSLSCRARHQKYLLFGLLLQQQGGLAQLIHLLAQPQVFLLQLQPLVADADAVVPGRRQGAVQPPHLLLAAGQLLAVAADERVKMKDQNTKLSALTVGVRLVYVVVKSGKHRKEKQLLLHLQLLQLVLGALQSEAGFILHPLGVEAPLVKRLNLPELRLCSAFFVHLVSKATEAAMNEKPPL